MWQNNGEYIFLDANKYFLFLKSLYLLLDLDFVVVAVCF